MQQEKEMADAAKESPESIKKERAVQPEGKQTPWYRNVSTLISFVALLLSLGTTYFAYTRAEAQKIQNMKAELRGILEKLSSLPREYEEGMGKHRGDHNVEGAVTFTISQQNSLLTTQAAALARQLPKDSVSATEWYAIAIGLQSDLRHEEAKEFLGYALESAKGLTDKVSVLRTTADLLFRMGKPREGRDTYETALGVLSDFAGYDDRTKNEMQIQTHLGWAESEAYIGLPEEATKQIAKAKSYAEKLPKDRRTDMITATVMGAEQNVTTQGRPANASAVIPGNMVKNPPRPTPLVERKTHHTERQQAGKRRTNKRQATTKPSRGRRTGRRACPNS